MISESTSVNIDSLHNDLKIAKELVYDKCDFLFTSLEINSESVEYGACKFKLNGKHVQHRVSRTTPKKTGQFVTIWKRNKNGLTEPFDISDDIDFIMITARSGDNFGQFIFPKNILADKGVIRQNGKEGKRGIRVYPPWDIVANKQAEHTQNWQTKYFLTIKSDNSTDFELAKKLISKVNGADQ